mgnify:CR=1 FL=1
MKRFTTITVLVVLSISIVGVVYYSTIIQPRRKMVTQLLSHFPEGFGNPDDVQTWEVIITVRQRKLEDMAKPGYKEREQEKMAQLGVDIVLTDEMVRLDQKKFREEVQFAQDQLDRIRTRDDR